MSASVHPRLSIYIALFFVLLSNSLIGQTVFEIDNDFFIGTCSGILTDDGGLAGNHANGGQQQITICSNSAQPDETHIRLTFTQYDYAGTLQIYNSDFTDPGALFYEDTGTEPLPIVVEATAANQGGGCLTIVFTPSGTGPGFAANIECIQSCQSVRANLDSSTPILMPADTGYIDLCFGDTVTLNGSGIYNENNIAYTQSDATSTFRWFMEDGTILEGPSVSHVYQRAGGYLVQLQVTDASGCVSNNLINQRVRVAGVPLFPIQNQIPDEVCANELLELTASVELDPNDSSSLFAFSDTFFFSQPATVADSFYLPDVAPGQDFAEYSSSVEFSSFPFGSTITSADDLTGLCVNMEHSYGGDLRIQLECPNGTVITMMEQPNGLGGTYLGEAIDFDDSPNPGVGYDYCWRPDATDLMRDARTDGNTVEVVVNGNNGIAVAPGDYASEQPFSDLIGCPLNGEWQFRVIDELGIDNGYVFSWSIELAAYLFPDRESFNIPVVSGMWIDNDNLSFYSEDSISSIPQFAGEAGYVFQVRDTFGCVNDTILTVDVLPYSSPDCYECGASLLDSTSQSFTDCSGGSIQTSLASRTSVDTTIAWADFPYAEFSFETNPNPARLFRSAIDVNSMRPVLLNDALAQIQSVCIDIETVNTNEVTLFLEAPNGNRMLLVRDRGSASNFTSTCFTPTATNSILSGNSPFMGEFEPEGNWTDLNGTIINGEWAIIAWDRAGFNSPGRFLNWSIEFTHQNPISYSWAPTDGLSCTDCPAPQINTATSQVYTLTATDAYGCTEVGTVEVSVGDIEINLVAIEPVSCFGASDGTIDIDVVGAVGDITYTWDDPNLQQILQDAVSLEAGTYSVTATDENNCLATFTATVTEPDDITINFTPTNVECRGQSTGTALAQPFGGNGGFSYSWETGAATALVTDLSAGTFSVTVTDSEGCTAINTVTINEPANGINLSSIQDQAGCDGAEQNVATVTALGGSAPYTYAWANGQTTPTATNLPAGDNLVSITDFAGCTETLNVSVQDLEPITFNLIDSRPSCSGELSGEMGFNQLMGGAPTTNDQYSYLWSDGQTSVVATNLSGGIEYSLTITDSQGCTGEASRFLVEPALLSAITTGSSTSCFGFADGTASVSNIISPNTGTPTIQWDVAAGSSTDLTAINLAAGTYSFTVTDAAGCTFSDVAMVTQPTELRTSLNQADATCASDADGSIIPTVNGGIPNYTYTWSNGSTSTTLTQLIAGNYTLTVTDANGCESVESAVITAPDPVVAAATAEPVICFGDATGRVNITASGGREPFTYSVDNSGYSRGQDFLGLTAGVYTVFARDAAGCIGTTQITVPDGPEFMVDLGEDQTIVFGDSIRLDADVSGGVDSLSFFWEGSYDGTLLCRGSNEPRETSTVVGCESPNARPEYEIDYTLRVVDANGCEADDRLRVSVQKFRVVEVPTGFTPNNDGNNDLLLVHGRPGTKIGFFRIFDRWGELIYERIDFDVNDTAQGWDGNYKNEIANSGVYLWQLKVIYEDESEEILAGETNLLRQTIS